jgi:hypothetical protein
MLGQLILDHYLIDTLDMLTKNANEFNRPVIKLREDLLEWAEEVEPQMVELIKDFTVFVCCDELRYLNHFKGVRYKKKVNPANAYSRDSLAKGTLAIFSCPGWESGYGGEKWATVARTMVKPPTVSRVALNNMLNACHNNGTVFNRSFAEIKLHHPYKEGGPCNSEGVTQFLSYLTTCGPLYNEVPSFPDPLEVSYALYGFLERAINLGLTTANLNAYSPVAKEYPSPVTWGDKEFEADLHVDLNWETKPHSSNDEDGDESDEDNDEDNEEALNVQDVSPEKPKDYGPQRVIKNSPEDGLMFEYPTW